MTPRFLLVTLSCVALIAACGSVETPEDKEPKMGGIGAMLRVESATGALSVDKLATRGAATAAGIRLYERIFAIDGQPVIGQPIEASVARLTGPVGTKVQLKVGESPETARDVMVVRAELPPDVLECLSGGCKNGNGTSVDRWGERYQGDFENGRYHGRGTLVEPSGRKYEGEWVDGMAHGQGVYTGDGGTRVEGMFEGGYPVGVAKFTLTNGDIYEGESKNYLMHGQGKLTRPSNGDVWEGTWEHGGLVDGTWLHHPDEGDGRNCTRAVVEGDVAAEGRISYAEGDKKRRVQFEGEFGDDCVANGEGLMIYTRKKMQGPFADDKPQRGAKRVR